MATDGSLKVTTLTTGSNLDTSAVDYAGTTKHQQRVNISDGTASEVAAVLATVAGTSEVGLVTREAGALGHDSADSTSYPVQKIGGVGNTSRITAVTAGDRCQLWTDSFGAPFVNVQPVIGGVIGVGDGTIRTMQTVASGANAITAGNSVQLISAGGLNVYTYILGVDLSVSVAAGAATISLQTGGSDIFVWGTAAASTSISVNAAGPAQYICKSAANTSVTIKVITSNCTVSCNLRYVQITNSGTAF